MSGGIQSKRRVLPSPGKRKERANAADEESSSADPFLIG